MVKRVFMSYLLYYGTSSIYICKLNWGTLLLAYLKLFLYPFVHIEVTFKPFCLKFVSRAKNINSTILAYFCHAFFLKNVLYTAII